MNALQSVGYQATRAADTVLGAAATAAESIGEAARRDPRRELERVRGELDTSVRRFERRGAQARKRTIRELERRRERFTTRVQETAGRSS